MRIVHLVNSLATGGAERVVVELTKAGLAQGHDVRILTLTDEEGSPRLEASKSKLPVDTLASWGGPLTSRSAVKRATTQADLLHAHLFPSLYVGVGFDGPKVFTEHNSTNRRRENQLFTIPDRIAYESYDALVGVSHAVSNNLRAYIERIGARTALPTTIYNGVPEHFFRLLRPRRADYCRLLLVGSFTPQKNHSLALEALQLLPTMTLDLAGAGPLEASVRKQAKNLGVEKRVNFRGEVADIRTLMGETDILLSTSIFEGFGLAVAEAQATGMPVVAPNVGGVREVFQDGFSGMSFSNYQAYEVARKIREVAREESYEALSKGAREYAARFSLSSSSQNYLSLYRELIE